MMFFLVKANFQIDQGTLGVCLASLAFTQLFAAGFQRGQNAEIGFHGLEVCHIRVGDIVAQRSQHCRGWKSDQWLAIEKMRCIEASQQSGGDIAHVPFHACDLPGKEQVVAHFVL